MKNMQKNLMLIGAALTLSGCAVVTPTGSAVTTTAPTSAGPALTKVTVIGLNDFHGNLEPTTFAGVMVPDPKDPTKQVKLTTGGIEVIGGYLGQERAKNPNLTFVGAGDLIGASPVTSSLLRDEPSVIGLSKIGLRVSSLGNHEFDQGFKELLRMQNGGCDSNDTSKACKFQNPYPGASFHWLGANVVYKASGKPALPPYAIQTIGGAKIAFIGAVTKTTPTIVSPDGIADLNFLDEAESANKYVPMLKAQGVDAIILLIHEGGVSQDGFDKPACGTLSGPIVDIANRLDPAVTAIISGHTHKGYNCLVNGRTIIQGDYYGHLLQRLDLTIDRAAHKVTDIQAANVVMDPRTTPKDAAMTELVGRAKALTDKVKQTPIGTITGSAILRTQNDAGESPLGDVIADSQLAATTDKGAQIAFMNPGGIRMDLNSSAGAVTFGDAYAVQPFGNTLVVMDLTGAQIKSLLEQQFDNPSSGQNRMLQVSKGFSYRYDGSAPAGQHIDAGSLQLNGQSIDPAKTYRVTANSFLAGGGDNFTAFKSGINVLQLPNVVDVDSFAAYLKANPGLNPAAETRYTKAK